MASWVCRVALRLLLKLGASISLESGRQARMHAQPSGMGNSITLCYYPNERLQPQVRSLFLTYPTKIPLQILLWYAAFHLTSQLYFMQISRWQHANQEWYLGRKNNAYVRNSCQRTS